MNHNQITNFIWSIANLIRDHYRRSKYPDVILPFTVLRRLDCVLEPTKEQVLETHHRFKDQLAPEALDAQLQRASGFVFYNTSNYDSQRLLQDPDAVYPNITNYLNGFSENMKEVIANFKLRKPCTRPACSTRSSRPFPRSISIPTPSPTPRWAPSSRNSSAVSTRPPTKTPASTSPPATSSA